MVFEMSKLEISLNPKSNKVLCLAGNDVDKIESEFFSRWE